MRAYERLLKYAKVYTTSDPESGTHPSAAREFDLAHLLVEEMQNAVQLSVLLKADVGCGKSWLDAK